MDYEEIEAVVGVLQGSRTLTELEVRSGDRVIRVRRASASASAPAPRSAGATTPVNALVPALPEPPTLASTKRTIVTSHLVGIFYMNRTVSAAEGDTVKKGQVLGQIEAMRLMNDCTASVSGTVAAVLVEDGQPVEYGQPLFEIEPSA